MIKPINGFIRVYDPNANTMRQSDSRYFEYNPFNLTIPYKGDLDGDNDVDEDDLALFAPYFGQSDCTGGCLADLDNDGDVDGLDLATLIRDYE